MVTVYFNVGAAEKAETWQIITPVRGMAYGVRDLNRLIQTTYRANTIESAKQRFRKIPKPMGPESIVYGDKVINVSNHNRKNVFPKEVRTFFPKKGHSNMSPMAKLALQSVNSKVKMQPGKDFHGC